MVRKPQNGKPTRKSLKHVKAAKRAKTLRMFGDNALKIVSTVVEEKGVERSLVLSLMRGIARGSPITHTAWDGELARRAAREALTLIGEEW